MPKPLFLRIPVLLTSCLLVLPTLEVQARAWTWAKRLPVNHYSPEDIQIVKQTMRDTLDTGPDGQAGQWSNPDTGHSGSITPLTSVNQNGQPCRQTRFSSDVQGEKNVSEFFLCKQADGEWLVQQPTPQ